MSSDEQRTSTSQAYRKYQISKFNSLRTSSLKIPGEILIEQGTPDRTSHIITPWHSFGYKRALHVLRKKVHKVDDSRITGMSRVILVTGSNSSIGYELVRILAEKGHVVYLGARNEVAGKEAAETLQKKGLTNVKFIMLDVTILSTMESAKEAIEKVEGKLDVLVNNAAIARPDSNQNPSIIPIEAIRDVYNTNVFGLIQTTTTFIPLLRKSSLPIILNVSSGLGSSTLQSRPGARRLPFIAYQSSKAAVNSYTVGLAQELKDEGFKVNAVTPGMVASRLNNFIAGGKSLEEGARALVPYALLDANGPTSKFFNWEGEEVPW